MPWPGRVEQVVVDAAEPFAALGLREGPGRETFFDQAQLFPGLILLILGALSFRRLGETKHLRPLYFTTIASSILALAFTTTQRWSAGLDGRVLSISEGLGYDVRAQVGYQPSRGSSATPGERFSIARRRSSSVRRSARSRRTRRQAPRRARTGWFSR